MRLSSAIDREFLMDAVITPTKSATAVAAVRRPTREEAMEAVRTLIAWAEKLGHDEVVRFLNTNLNEEKAANTKLNTIALRKGINTKASNAA